MKNTRIMLIFLLVAGLIISSCSKNYYSGTGKGGKNCGCPSHKGMSGY